MMGLICSHVLMVLLPIHKPVTSADISLLQYRSAFEIFFNWVKPVGLGRSLYFVRGPFKNDANREVLVSKIRIKKGN